MLQPTQNGGQKGAKEWDAGEFDGQVNCCVGGVEHVATVDRGFESVVQKYLFKLTYCQNLPEIAELLLKYT